MTIIHNNAVKLTLSFQVQRKLNSERIRNVPQIT